MPWRAWRPGTGGGGQEVWSDELPKCLGCGGVLEGGGKETDDTWL